MVLGAINYNVRSRLLIIHGNLTARLYIDEILRPELVPQLQCQRRPMIFQHDEILRPELVPQLQCQRRPMIFQHDNALPHTAKLTQGFLRQKGINVLPWPSKSPDLNVIKHLWDELGRRVRRRQQVPQTLRQLSTALQQERDNIPRRTIRRLCSTMRSRLRHCLQNYGGHTRY